MADEQQQYTDIHQLVDDGIKSGKAVNYHTLAAAIRKQSPKAPASLGDGALIKQYSAANPALGIDKLQFDLSALSSPTPAPSAPPSPAATTPPPSSNNSLFAGPVGRWGERVIGDITTGAARVVGAPTGREKAAGAHQMIGGTMEAMAPGMAAMLPVAPVAAVRGLATGGIAQAGTEELLKKVGVPPEYAQLGGDVVGIVLGGRAAKGRAKIGASTTEAPPGAPRPAAAAPAAALDYNTWRDTYFKRQPQGHFEDVYGQTYTDERLHQMHGEANGGQPIAPTGQQVPPFEKSSQPAPEAPVAPKLRNQDIADILRREAAANPKRQVNAEDIAVILKEGHGKTVSPQARTRANRILGELVDDGVLTSDRRILSATTTPPGAAAPVKPVAPKAAAAAPAAPAPAPAPVSAPLAATPAPAAPTAAPPGASAFTPEQIAEAQELFPEPAPSAGRTPEAPAEGTTPAAPPAVTPASAPAEPAVAATEPPPAPPGEAPTAGGRTPEEIAALGRIGDKFKRFGREESGQQYFSWTPRPGEQGPIKLESQDLRDVYTIGKMYFREVGQNFGQWRDAMVNAFSDVVAPHLQSLWGHLSGGGAEELPATAAPPGAPAAAAPPYMRWENFRIEAPPAAAPQPPLPSKGEVLSHSAGTYGLTPEEAEAGMGRGTGPTWEAYSRRILQENAPPIPEPPAIIGRGKNAKVVPPQPRVTVTPQGSPDVSVKPKLAAGMTPEQIAAERTAALTARPPGLPEIELGKRMAQAIRGQENFTEAQKASAFEQEQALRQRGSRTQRPPGAPAPEPPQEIPQRPYLGSTQAKDVAIQAMKDAGFQGRTIMNRNAVMQVRDPDIKARLMRDAMTPTARQHGGGFRGKATPRGLARPGVMAESEMMTPSQLVEYLQKDQLPSSRVFSKPVADGVIQVQWNDEFQAWNATKIYTDTGQVHTISGVGPESLTNYLNRAQQIESPVRASQRVGRSYAGGSQVTSAPIVGTPTTAPPPAPAGAERQLAATSAKFTDPALYEEYLRGLARKAKPATPETIAEYERLRTEERERAARKIVPLPREESSSLREQLSAAQAAQGEESYEQPGEEDEIGRRPVRGALHTPGDIRPPDLRERNVVAAQDVSDDAARRIVAEHSKRIAAAGEGFTPEERARAEAARGKPGARAKPAKESPFEVRPAKGIKGGEEFEMEGEKFIEGGEEAKVGNTWQVHGKDGSETNIHIAKQGKMYRVYVGNRGGVGYTNLISAKNEAIKVAERAAYRVVQRNAPFRVAGAGEYMMLGETPEGNIHYQFTPEGGAPIEHEMQPAKWEHLQQVGEPVKPPVEPEQAKRGRPAKDKGPEVKFTPPTPAAPSAGRTPAPAGPPEGMAASYNATGFWTGFTYDPASGMYLTKQGGKVTPAQVQDLIKAGRSRQHQSKDTHQEGLPV